MATSLAAAIEPLAAAGFDIAHRFDGDDVARALGLPELAAPSGILVGNTRALWPRFLAARRADPALIADPDPLDRYTERTLARVLTGVANARVYVGHRRYAGAYLPLQQIAALTGLGTLSPGNLVIHPVYGPWFALRAIIVGDGERPVHAPIAAPCRCEVACRAALAQAVDARGDASWRAWLAVRDACTVGRAHRYGDAQLHYHYTKDPAALR